MDEETNNLLKKYSKALRDQQKTCQALRYSLQRACDIISNNNKKDSELMFNLLIAEGQDKIEVFYGKESN